MKCLQGLTVVVGLLGLVAATSAQDVDEGGASPYFDCPYVNYFDTDCPQRSERDPRVPVAGHRAPTEEEPVATRQGEVEDGDATQREVLPEELILFPRESLAPDAPPLFRILLANPTLENARRYVRWHARRTAQLQAVQALIRRAGNELGAAPHPNPLSPGE